MLLTIVWLLFQLLKVLPVYGLAELIIDTYLRCPAIENR